MCGIVGYVGRKNAKDIILDGLKKLEYRGYDSSGLALLINGEFAVKKSIGGISELVSLTQNENLDSNIGIGHTRWATHGAPSIVNSHPHLSSDKKVAIVHNGIIENYVELKEELIKKYGITFESETDTEVVAHLIGINLRETKNLEEAIFLTSKEIKGAYSIVAMSIDESDKIIGIRNDAPLIIGTSNEGTYVASDITALLSHADKIYPIENSEMVILKEDGFTILDENRKIVKRDELHIDWDLDAAEKEGYEHFLLKEIFEQPKVVKNAISNRLDSNGDIKFDGLKLSKEEIDKIDRIYIVACGTSYYAGLIGKALLEKYVKIPTECEIASEFRYREPIINEHTLFVALSQSGETSDTLQALRDAKKKGARILSIVNVVGSSVARESDDTIYQLAGPEISVASTKAYTTQLISLYLLSLYIGKIKGIITKEFLDDFISELSNVPLKMSEYLNSDNGIEKLANNFSHNSQIFYIGRGMDSALAYEGSLKLKEISYINSFAIPAGELKHGTIALMEKGSTVFAISSQDKLLDKMESNMQEVRARGAYIIALTKEGNSRMESHADYTIYVPRFRDEIMPLVSVIPLQLFAYYVALKKGCSIDKPRNLAKSVTVE